MTIAQAPGRVPSLDGLRGLAALVVLAHHVALAWPSISDAYLRPDLPGPAPWSTSWWLTSTPAHLLIAGPEAVLVFFVISGIALTIPVLQNTEFNWMAYYPRRSVRLYLPVVASVLLAALLLVVVPLLYHW